MKPIQNLVTNIATHTSSLKGEKLDNFKKVENIDEKLEKIGTLYTISAYLRSAIKEKDNRFNEISQKILQILHKVEEKVEEIDFETLDKLKNVTIEDFLKTFILKKS